MRKLTELPPLDTVKQYVALCPGSPSGLAYAKSGRFAVARNGSLYIVIIKNVKYMAARVLFYIKYGIDPGSLVMHGSGPISLSQAQHISHAEYRRKKPKTSKYRGVCWHKPSSKWIARVKHNARCMYLGTFKDEVSAARAYDIAVKQLFGDFARLNFNQQSINQPIQPSHEHFTA